MLFKTPYREEKINGNVGFRPTSNIRKKKSRMKRERGPLALASLKGQKKKKLQGIEDGEGSLLLHGTERKSQPPPLFFLKLSHGSQRLAGRSDMQGQEAAT